MRKLRIVAVGAVATLALAACGSGGSDAGGGAAHAPHTVAVEAQPELKPVLKKLAAAYTAAHPTQKVSITAVDASSVSAAVSQRTTDVAVLPDSSLVSSGNVKNVGTFGRALAVIAVPAANPGNVAGLQAFSDTSRLRTLICGVDTDIGNASVALLRNAHVSFRASTLSKSKDCPAKALSQLSSGQLDAALVFRNDVTFPSGVKTIPIPDRQNVIFPLKYVVVRQNADATAFGQFLTSAPAQNILTENGYLP